jgi:hypothetical protein
MNFSILYVIIPLAFISSCVNKNNTEAVATDPNELKKTEVENMDSLAIKGFNILENPYSKKILAYQYLISLFCWFALFCIAY